MPMVTIQRGEERQNVQVPLHSSLLDAVRKAGLPISMPCGGGGRCGKCLVHAEGELGHVDPSERTFLEGLAVNMRLACCAEVLGSCEIFLPKESEAVVETAYSAWEGTLEPIYPGDFGAAFDIGTTTIAGQIFRRNSKRPLASMGEMNDQQSFGADVLSRASYCNENECTVLRDMVRKQLAAMLEKLCVSANVEATEISGIVVAGNSIMMYIFSGMEPRPLSMAPFAMEEHFGKNTDFSLPGFPDAPIYIPESSSAYIGADITCSVLAGELAHHAGNVLLIDAGTNGEMVLRTETGDMVCCSAAVGPAFEGAGISSGSNAREGAIESVRYLDGGFCCNVIGGGEAQSICGSGLIDAVAAMLDAGVINSTGMMDKKHGGRFLLPGTKVGITQKDIRQLQMAKSAVRSGMDTLLHECGLEYEALHAIILCGGFGSYLSPQNAERIGMLPKGVLAKTRAIGNAAGNGAGQILQSKEKQREARSIFDRMKTVELATNRFFLKRFIEAMSFDD